MKKTSFSILFLFLVGWTILSSFDSNEVPEKDRAVLENFLNATLFKERIAYVLFGSKPVGTISFMSLPIPGNEPDHNKILREGWEMWCRYRQLLASEKWIVKSIGNEEENGFITVLFLHKDHFKEVVEKHRDVFENILQETVEVEKMLAQFEADSDPFQSVLRKQHVLIGILFGFGRDNSLAFQRDSEAPSAHELKINLFGNKTNEGPMLEILRTRNELFSGQRNIQSLNLIESRKRFIRLYRKLDEICDAQQCSIKHLENRVTEMKLLDDPENNPVLGLPVFSADPRIPETKKLREKYCKERKEILQKCQGKSMLAVYIENR